MWFDAAPSYFTQMSPNPSLENEKGMFKGRNLYAMENPKVLPSKDTADVLYAVFYLQFHVNCNWELAFFENLSENFLSLPFNIIAFIIDSESRLTHYDNSGFSNYRYDLVGKLVMKL